MTDAEVNDPSGSVVKIQSEAPEGPADSTSPTIAHAGKEEGYSDSGNGSQRPTVSRVSTPGQDSHPPAAARGRRPSDATTLGGQVRSGQP